MRCLIEGVLRPSVWYSWQSHQYRLRTLRILYEELRTSVDSKGTFARREGGQSAAFLVILRI
jgi:hypothetical protein